MIRKTPESGQEQLFLLGPSEVVIPSSFVDSGSVDIIERAVHLRTTIDLLAQVNIRDGFLRSPKAQRSYGDKKEAVVEGVKRRAHEYQVAAKYEFLRAFGADQLIDDQTKSFDTKEELRASFESFAKGNNDTTNESDNVSIYGLRDKIDSNIQYWVSAANRQNEDRPHEDSKKLTIEDGGGGDGRLSTQERLTAIHEDPRAGFLPTTNTEKNFVLSMLDYFDNPEYKLGPRNQLLEVVRFHHKKLWGAEGYKRGKTAVISIAYMFGDFYMQSAIQLAQLEQLSDLLAEEVNPNINLHIALLEKVELAAPLIRYMDLLELRRHGKVEHEYAGESHQPRLDPLTAVRNEKDAGDGKNKLVEDRYTTIGERHDETTKWLAKRASQVTVGDVRQIIGRAVADQQRRNAFHRLILQEIDQKKATVELGEAAKVAHKILYPEVA